MISKKQWTKEWLKEMSLPPLILEIPEHCFKSLKKELSAALESVAHKDGRIGLKIPSNNVIFPLPSKKYNKP